MQGGGGNNKIGNDNGSDCNEGDGCIDYELSAIVIRAMSYLSGS